MKVAMALTARPSYAKLHPIIKALVARDVDVCVLACASSLLERYGRVVDVVRRDFQAVRIVECWSAYEGSTLVTSAKETGALLIELSGVLAREQPDLVVVMADRHEVLAAAQAASYLHLKVVHCQGGECSGSIDDKVRNSITALADYHFTATERAKYRVVGLTGAYDRVWNVGCPSIDLAKRALREPPVTNEELGGTGPAIDFDRPFLIVLQHPDTRYAEQAHTEMVETLESLEGRQAIVFWPGQDAGMEGASKAIRERAGLFRTVRNLPPSRYLRLLAQASCAVGNSSSFIREAAFLGTPVVSVGLRQWGRERAANVLDGPHDQEWIREAIRVQLACGRYESSSLYGRGDAGERIAEVLCGLVAS